MGWFEHQHVYIYHKQPLLWVRFIDDIFQIWQHGMQEFCQFEAHLNNCVPSIKFETEISESEVHFLDTTVSIDPVANVIHTNLYTKPTEAHKYLSYKSCHPSNCKSAIPYSQFLRLRRICSKEEDFVTNARRMAGYFLKADYPADIIQKGFSKAFHNPRHTLLAQGRGSTPTSDDKDEFLLTTTYHSSGRIHRPQQLGYPRKLVQHQRNP